MKKLTTLLALIACTAIASAQKGWNVYPDSFQLSGATTTESIKTLFNQDSQGMYLIQSPKGRLSNNEVGMELVGSTSGVSIHTITFNIGSIEYAGDVIVRRVEFFNYATNVWDNVLRTKTNPALPDLTRPVDPPSASVTVNAAMYVNPITNAFRTRVYWSSPSPFKALWLDFAGWTLTE